MIRKVLLLLLVLLLSVRSQRGQGWVRILRQSNMSDGNQEQNLAKLGSLVPSHNKPEAVIAANIQKQQHKNGNEGVMRDNNEKNVTFVEGLERNMSSKHVTAEQRSKTQMSEISPSQQLAPNQIQNQEQLAKKQGITSLISEQANNDLKDQKQSISQMKQNMPFEALPSNTLLTEGKITQKPSDIKSQIYRQVVKIQKKQPTQTRQISQLNRVDQSKGQSNTQFIFPQQQIKNGIQPLEQNKNQQSKAQEEMNVNKTQLSEISIQIIQSPSEQQVSKQVHPIVLNQSVVKEPNSPKAVEVFKVLQEIKVQNKSVETQQITQLNQSAQIQAVPPTPQDVQGQITIISMDNGDQDQEQQQNQMPQASQPTIINLPSSQTTPQLNEKHEQAKETSNQTQVILPQAKKTEYKQTNKIDIQNEQENVEALIKQAQVDESEEEEEQVKVEIIEINQEDQPIQPQKDITLQQKQQQQSHKNDIQEDHSPEFMNQFKHQQQIINEFYSEPIQQSDIKLSITSQNKQPAPFTTTKQDKSIPTQQPIIPSAPFPHQEIKNQQLQVLLTSVKQNLEGKAKVDLIQHLQKQIKLNEQLKAIQSEKAESKLAIHRQSQYANLKESSTIQKDLQLPPQQNMDAQTVIVIIILTFIISIPIVKEIRQKPNKNEPQKQKQSVNNQMVYPQDNQSGFEVDETFDQEYLGQAGKNPSEQTWQRQIEEA